MGLFHKIWFDGEKWIWKSDNVEVTLAYTMNPNIRGGSIYLEKDLREVSVIGELKRISYNEFGFINMRFG